jgi:hypothetical protein
LPIPADWRMTGFNMWEIVTIPGHALDRDMLCRCTAPISTPLAADQLAEVMVSSASRLGARAAYFSMERRTIVALEESPAFPGRVPPGSYIRMRD